MPTTSIGVAAGSGDSGAVGLAGCDSDNAIVPLMQPVSVRAPSIEQLRINDFIPFQLLFEFVQGVLQSLKVVAMTKFTARLGLMASTRFGSVLNERSIP